MLFFIARSLPDGATHTPNFFAQACKTVSETEKALKPSESSASISITLGKPIFLSFAFTFSSESQKYADLFYAT